MPVARKNARATLGVRRQCRSMTLCWFLAESTWFVSSGPICRIIHQHSIKPSTRIRAAILASSAPSTLTIHSMPHWLSDRAYNNEQCQQSSLAQGWNFEGTFQDLRFTHVAELNQVVSSGVKYFAPCQTGRSGVIFLNQTTCSHLLWWEDYHHSLFCLFGFLMVITWLLLLANCSFTIIDRKPLKSILSHAASITLVLLNSN